MKDTLQPETCNVQPAACNLQPETCNLPSATGNLQPITLDGFPQAIIHFDGDAFFASVEQAVHPEWKGRPLVTGQERGIIACASYEAKALGIQRGVALHVAQRMCPTLVVVPSDYETYSLYSKRMFDIARRFTPLVEEHSIDEGFADLTGLRRLYHCSYEDIARRFQAAVQGELGIGVSVGLSLSKSLAKLCSKFRKPHGFTAVAGYHIHLLLARTPLAKVWGFGPNTVALLTKLGLRSALDFVRRPEPWAAQLLGKIGRELCNELRGTAVYPVVTEEKSARYTVSKCKTFTAPSADREFVLAKLLRARTLAVVLRHKDYSQDGLEVRLDRATAATQEIAPVAAALGARLYRPGVAYRSTMIVLGGLEDDRERQRELFADNAHLDKLERASAAIDTVNGLFGKHKLGLGSALYLDQHAVTARDLQPWRKNNLLPGETARQHLFLPRWAITV
jgi:DNA polymerase-4/DNA polymerase V